jgi:hypothetical protein
MQHCENKKYKACKEILLTIPADYEGDQVQKVVERTWVVFNRLHNKV